MDFRDSPGEREFRSRLRAWLAEHAPPEPMPTDPDARAEFLNTWQRELYRAGWIGLSFAKEYGGQALPELYEAIFNDELGAAGAPPAAPIGHLAHALRLYGTEEQKERHIPGLLSGEVRWCQGFSEPGAGSDLAGLATRADRVQGPDGAALYRITGQKIWTSDAVWADWCLLLLRTEPGSERHRGISILLVPMKTPGIECRPIVTAAGTREFAQVYFDGAEVSAENLLGEPGQGWHMAMSLLGYERGPADVAWVSRLARALRHLEDDARKGVLRADSTARARLARAYVDVRVLQLQVQRSLSARRDGAPPGPEGSIDKLLLTRAEQNIMHILLDLRGAPPLLRDGLEMDAYFWSRGQAIMGGTRQIQRNIVAQRVLGLPRS